MAQYQALLNGVQRILIDSESEARRKQLTEQRKSRDELIRQHESRRTDTSNSLLRQLTFLPMKYRPCTSPLSGLRQIMIKHLVAEGHHYGYILLRTIALADRDSGIATVAEDENGDAVVLRLQHQETEKERPAREILEKGTILIVKEPYLSVIPNGECGIHVDHLSDFDFLPIWDYRVPRCWNPSPREGVTTAIVWKSQGNDFFKKSEYHKAIEWWVTNSI